MGCTSAKQVSAVPNDEEGRGKAYSNGDLFTGQLQKHTHNFIRKVHINIEQITIFQQHQNYWTHITHYRLQIITIITLPKDGVSIFFKIWTVIKPIVGLNPIIGKAWSITIVALNKMFKGIVHPKMKIVTFTHPLVIPNLFDFLLWNTKDGILKNIFSNVFCPPNESQ